MRSKIDSQYSAVAKSLYYTRQGDVQIIPRSYQTTYKVSIVHILEENNYDVYKPHSSCIMRYVYQRKP